VERFQITVTTHKRQAQALACELELIYKYRLSKINWQIRKEPRGGTMHDSQKPAGKREFFTRTSEDRAPILASAAVWPSAPWE